VRRTLKRKRIDVNSAIKCTTEEPLFDTSKAKLSELVVVEVDNFTCYY
jgi:hypothetical protein